MSVTRIASRYSKSLIDLAIEQDKLETILEDIQNFRNIADHRELSLLLKSPIVKGDKKKAILKEIFEGKVDTLTMRFLELIVDKGREELLQPIADQFVFLYKKYKHISSIVLTTAEKLSDASLKALEAKLNESSATDDVIEIETRVNPKLIGGFIVEFDDKRYDASVAHKLNTLKKEFDINLYEKNF
ncbi:MAG: ATP synthase F1 subunit delta [Bacteroidia bacterium]|nr:ATP synthase F1 subunit delta [Bacteroidia bacterium]